jgi:hypothetical protein
MAMARGATETLTLGKTVFARGRYIREVRMRAPTQADIEEAGAVCETDGERGMYLVAKLCDITPAAFRRMSEEDIERLGAMYDRLAPQ